MHFLELPGSEDDLDSEIQSDADELWDKNGNMMEEKINKFREMFMEKFDISNVMD